MSFPAFCVCLELRSLPSTRVTRFPRYYEPLRHPRAPGLSLTGVRLVLSSLTYRLGEEGQLMPHEAEQAAIREMVALRAAGKTLRAIAGAAQARGFNISHEGVKGVLRAASPAA